MASASLILFVLGLLFACIFVSNAEFEIAEAKVVVCAIVRDEEKYIDEWLRYNKYLGFDHVYLYDNSDIPSNYLLGLHLVHEDFVTVRHFPGMKAQEPAYNNFLRTHKHENMWAAVIDVDEFIALRQHKTIQDFLRAVAPKGGSVALNWRRFSNSGVKKESPGPVVARFTYTTQDVSHFSQSVTYLPHAMANNIHDADMHHGHRRVDVRGELMPHGVPWKGFERNGEIAFIAHYHTKSLEEYVIKRHRGRVDLDNHGGHVSYTQIVEEFEKYNTPYCEVEDTSVRDFYLSHFFGSIYTARNTGIIENTKEL